MNTGRTSRRCFLGYLLLVTIAILSASNVPLAHAEEVAEVVVDATGDVEVQAEEEPVEVGGPVEEEEPVAVDEPVEEEEEPVVVDEPVEEDSGVDEAVVEEATTEEAETNIVDEVTDAAKSKISDIVEDIKDISPEQKKKIAIEIFTQIKEMSPQQKKKIAAGALGVWGVAAGAGWVLNNLGGSDE